MPDRFDDIRADAACCAREYDTDKEKDSSLTDDWKAGKLEKCKRYWVKSPLSLETKPAFLYNDNSFDVDGTIYPNNYDLEVLASCDYDHFVELTEKVKSQDEELQRLNQLIDSQQQTNKAIGKKLIKLCELLKECNNELKILRMLSLPIASKEALAECDELLTRINAVLGESEE